MRLRLLLYMAQIWERQRQRWFSEGVPKSQWRLSPVVPILFYTGERRWEVPPDLTSLMDLPAALSRFVPSFDILHLDVKGSSVSDLTRSAHPFGSILTAMQQESGSESEMREALSVALSTVRSLAGVDYHAYRRVVVYLNLLILHRKGFDTDQRESLLRILEIEAPEVEVRQMAESMAEMLEKKGRAEGRAEGKMEEKQTYILRALRSRFETLPADVEEKVRSITNAAQLDHIFDSSLQAETFEDINWRATNRQETE